MTRKFKNGKLYIVQAGVRYQGANFRMAASLYSKIIAELYNKTIVMCVGNYTYDTEEKEDTWVRVVRENMAEGGMVFKEVGYIRADLLKPVE